MKACVSAASKSRRAACRASSSRRNGCKTIASSSGRQANGGSRHEKRHGRRAERVGADAGRELPGPRQTAHGRQGPRTVRAAQRDEGRRRTLAGRQRPRPRPGQPVRDRRLKPATRRDAALPALRRYGLLLESDPKLPSVVSLVAGKPIAGSWWGHPRGGAIYREVNKLADRSDVVLLKLLNGKVTFVLDRLWPNVYAIGCCGEPWQLSGLSPQSQRLVELARRNGLIRTDDPRSRLAAGPRISAVALDLERRVLVLGTQVHTETGRHVKSLESWPHWARRIKLATRMPAARAKAELAELVGSLNAEFKG